MGRRPVFIGTFIVYLASNIGLALSPNISALMVFRALQAVGSSATILLVSTLYLSYIVGPADNLEGAGVIADITTSAERGGLIGAFGGSMEHDPFY